MTSKYDHIYAVVGHTAQWNDKTTTGRVLKWQISGYSKMSKKDRDALAAVWKKKFDDAGVQVQKVQVRNGTESLTYPVKTETSFGYKTLTHAGPLKLSVYISPI